ncbi:MAG: hypothetical protein KAS38_11810 [Anaerolineales bacterium]|nr:hypothetical protein [Anaerolineales bacterium]MCK4976162.1 hypothetical protein [Anaerolineales bacterium]
MNERIDLDSLTRNTRKLEFEDGLNDLQNSLVFLLLSLFGLLTMSTAGITLYMRALIFNEEITIIAMLALIPLFVLITFGARSLIARYRKQVLWRDLGEVEPFRWQVDRRASVLATVIWLVVVIAGLVVFVENPMDLDATMRLVIAAGGIATGVIYFIIGQTLAIARYRWVGLIGGLLSAVLILAPLNIGQSWLTFGLIWILTLMISGISALRGTLMKLRAGVS